MAGLHRDTLAVAAGYDPAEHHNAVKLPPYASSTFAYPSARYAKAVHERYFHATPADRSEPGADHIHARLRVIRMAVSPGGIETLIRHPATITHFNMPEARPRAVGIDACSLRISVGLEHEGDLVADLLQALEPAWWTRSDPATGMPSTASSRHPTSTRSSW